MPRFSAFLALGLIVALSACQPAEERAEEHYQNALALIEQGDPQRAIVELRNVFQQQQGHKEARLTLARLLREIEPDPRPAYQQFLRVAEQYPEELEPRIALAEMAFLLGDLEELDRHGIKAAELAPDEPAVRAITVAREYRQAILGNDGDARAAAAGRARQLSATLTESLMLRSILADEHIQNWQYAEALVDIDWMLERQPESELLWRQRLNVLFQMGDMEAVETQLRELVDRFPAQATFKQEYVRFLISRQRLDTAEAFLRELAEAADPADAAPRIDLVQFVLRRDGAEAARAEIDRMVAEAADPIPFQVLGAQLDFSTGRAEGAIETLQGILDAAGPDADLTEVKVNLARMQQAGGNVVRARTLVEEVLSVAPGNPEALKMRAAWRIQSDDADGAVTDLRAALDGAPNDSGAMTLLADAYTRTGRPDLARDLLARAVEASGNAPTESITFARLMMNDDRFIAAEDALLPALRRAPQDLDLLRTLGDLYLRMEDLGRAAQVAQTMRAIGTPEAIETANALEAERLNIASGPQDAIAYLESLAEGADASMASRLALVRARLQTGDAEGALSLAQALADENPDEPRLALLVANTRVATGELDTAERLYRDIVAANPEMVEGWLQLIRVKMRLGDPQAARGTADEALAALPDDPNLLWVKAGFAEQDGDIDGAIEIYEALYAQDSNSIVVANNLASLLASYRADEASVERAWVVARRFRDTEIPALQDTFGWILHLRGESVEAVPYLESAAAAITEDALVQYHLGVAYQAAGRDADALGQLQKAIDVAGPTDTRAQIEDARARVAALQAAAE